MAVVVGWAGVAGWCSGVSKGTVELLILWGQGRVIG